MKKQILLLLLTFAINIQPQEDWLKADTSNRWQYIRNSNNQLYSLVTGLFYNPTIIDDTLYYKFSVSPYNTFIRYDSTSKCIEIICEFGKVPHCYIDLPNGNYSNLKSPPLITYGCVSGVNITIDSMIFSNTLFETRNLFWNFYFPPHYNDQYRSVYAKNLGIVYHYNIDRYGQNNTYSLFQCKVDGIVYKDSIQMGFEINPILTITEPNFRLIFKVTHPHNKIFPVGSGKTSLLMIDTVWFYSFYEKDGDTILVEPKQTGWLVGTENYYINTSLDLNLLSNGYSFNYKFKAVDRGLEPNIAYNPISGYYKAYLDTTISVDFVNDPLMDYELEQNFPNPFNSSTTIRFYSPEEDDISIEVYNILGQKIATLFNQRVAAGKYEVYFDESYNNNQSSSSVYFYQMKSSRKIITKKMIYQK